MKNHSHARAHKQETIYTRTQTRNHSQAHNYRKTRKQIEVHAHDQSPKRAHLMEHFREVVDVSGSQRLRLKATLLQLILRHVRRRRQHACNEDGVTRQNMWQ